jgi:hypothetical protein
VRFLILLALAMLTACTSTKPGSRSPGTIHHEVFIKLANPAEAEELITDSRPLGRIPGVTDWAVGGRFDSGRSNVLSDFDVGLYLRFARDSDYKAYVDDPAHQAFLAKWRPRFQTVQIRDFVGQ